MTVKEYQSLLKAELTSKFNQNANDEWNSKMGNGIYQPRLDVAVGPYAILRGERYDEVYLNLLHQHRDFFLRLIEIHLENVKTISNETDKLDRENAIFHKFQELLYANENARCFIVIEVENRISRKHLMGGAINASVLGKIGIAIGFTPEKHNCFLRLHRYFQYLQNVNKPTFKTDNLLIISSNQFLGVL